MSTAYFVITTICNIPQRVWYSRERYPPVHGDFMQHQVLFSCTVHDASFDAFKVASREIGRLWKLYADTSKIRQWIHTVNNPKPKKQSKKRTLEEANGLQLYNVDSPEMSTPTQFTRVKRNAFIFSYEWIDPFGDLVNL